MQADTTTRLISKGDGSHRVEDDCFPTPSHSSFKSHVLLQDNINLRRGSIKKGSLCKVMTNQGLLPPNCVSETLRAAHLNQKGEVLEILGVGLFQSRTRWCVQSDEGTKGTGVRGGAASAETCVGKRVAA